MALVARAVPDADPDPDPAAGGVPQEAPGPLGPARRPWRTVAGLRAADYPHGGLRRRAGDHQAHRRGEEAADPDGRHGGLRAPFPPRIWHTWPRRALVAPRPGETTSPNQIRYPVCYSLVDVSATKGGRTTQTAQTSMERWPRDCKRRKYCSKGGPFALGSETKGW